MAVEIHLPRIREMSSADWEEVSRIYSEGIESGLATFETTVPTWEEFDESRLAKPRLVLESSGSIGGWATVSPVSKRECYRGVAEFSIYLSSHAKGQGFGSVLLTALIAATEDAGIWTLQATILAENAASIRLVEKHGFRAVGRRERIALHRGAWCDTVVYERRSPVAGI